MFKEGDTKCVEALLKPAKKALKVGREIEYDPYEKRVGLWNEISENYDKYLDGECGEFLNDLDNHFRSLFATSLLLLAVGFKENGEDFKPAGRFNKKEVEAYKQIERYNVFEILTIEDIEKRIISEDEELLKLFKDYYVYMDKWVDETLNDSSIKLPVRFYLKNKWGNYKSNIDQAVSNLIVKLNWFRRLVEKWKSGRDDKPPIDELLKPVNWVLKHDSIKFETYNERTKLWNEIKENHSKYLEEDYKLSSDIDNQYRAQFEMALLTLATSFKENGEEFEDAERFSDKEIEAYQKIKHYSILENYNANELKNRVTERDDEIIDLFKDYYTYMNEEASKILNHSSIKEPISYYLNNKWKEYKSKLSEAAVILYRDLEWFRKMVDEWVGQKRTPIQPTDKSRLVEAGKAKQYERNFIGRLEKKLEDEVSIFGKTFEIENEIKEGKEVDVSKYIGMRSKYGVLTTKDVANLPENMIRTAKLVEKKMIGKKMIGKKREFTLKGIFASRVERYADYGSDTDPLGLKDVNSYIAEASEEARKNGEVTVLCLASPTGFDEDVGEHINSEDFHRNFLSKYLSVLLLDLETGKLIYNPHDNTAKEFAKICEMETDEEKRHETKNCIMNMMKGKDYVLFKDALACGEEDIVKAVFYEVAEEKGWKVRYVEDVGLVLMK